MERRVELEEIQIVLPVSNHKPGCGSQALLSTDSLPGACHIRCTLFLCGPTSQRVLRQTVDVVPIGKPGRVRHLVEGIDVLGFQRIGQPHPGSDCPERATDVEELPDSIENHFISAIPESPLALGFFLWFEDRPSVIGVPDSWSRGSGLAVASAEYRE